MDFRHEWKHEITYGDMLALQARLRAVIPWDSHGADGTYQVRSLYFDNLWDKALQEKLSGISRREKFRIRCYNQDRSLILLEKKSKVNQLCSKEKTVLSQKEAEEILQGGGEALAESEKPLVQELYRKMKTEGLRPKTIVDYTREAFVYGPGNVRVTLDRDIRTGMQRTDFLNPGCVTVPAGDAPVILEVKWDAYLPSLITDLVQLPGRHRAAFSKYAACRLYG